MQLHRVQHVEALANFRLKITFDDQREFIFDAAALPAGEIFAALKDPAAFAQVSIDPVSGNICWPNGADLDTQVLYYHDMLGQAIDPAASPNFHTS